MPEISAPLATICGVGAATPVGRTAWSTAAAVRAGIAGFGFHPVLADSVGEPLQIAACPWIPFSAPLADRMINMLGYAIGETLTTLRLAPDDPVPPLALLVAFPEPRLGAAPDLSADLMGRLAREFQGCFTTIECSAGGHAGGLLALERAVGASLARGAGVVVAAADSYMDDDTLDWLEATSQLHGAGPLNNAYGFVPGEGAGALLLLAPNRAAELSLTPLANIVATGAARELKGKAAETVCLGEGLAAAFRAAFERLPPAIRISDIYCDMNGEAERAEEYALALLRTPDRFVSAADFVAPADCFGDVGAAFGLLGIVLATIAGVKRYAKGNVSVVWAASERADRAVAVLEAV